MNITARLFMVLLASFAMAPSDARAEPLSRQPDAQVSAFFDDYVSRAITEGGIPGAALIVVRDGRVILSKGYGVADLETREPLSPDRHLLRQGSIAKVLTWIMVMQLVAEGKLNLDADVNRYLPFRIEQKFGRPITTRHLLTHSAGFTERFMGVIGRPDGSLCETLSRTLPDRPSAPGARASYSNSGAALAACIVEKITGRPFEEAVHERVFAPLNMRSSTFAQPPSKPLRSRMASQYGASAQTPRGFEYIALPPAGSLTASAEDMGRLLTAIMRGGSGEAGQVLSREAMTQMLQLQKPLAPGLPAGFGLGFIVRDYGERQFVGHGGTTTAAITDMEIVPDLGIGWYIGMTGLGLGGSATHVRQALPAAVIDRFGPRRALPRSQGPSSAAELHGNWLPARRYRSGPLKASDVNLVEVRADADGALRISSVTDDQGQPLRWIPQGRDRFVEERSGTALVAVRDSEGNITRFASTLVNPVSDMERAPAWLPAAVPLFAGSAGLVLIAGLTTGSASVIRRFRSKKPSKLKEDARTWRRPAHLGLGFLVVTLLGWFALIAIVSDDPYRLTTAHIPLGILGLMAVLAPAAAIPLFARSGYLLRGQRRTKGSFVALLGVAALTCSALFYALGLAAVSTDF